MAHRFLTSLRLHDLQVAEVATQLFVTNDRPNVAGLILAGSADFKTELSQSDMFDPRLQVGFRALHWVTELLLSYVNNTVTLNTVMSMFNDALFQ